jgi:nucleoside 2-deoxyribosyltransferase
MVCGSIGYGGIEKIKRLYKVLKEKGFDTVNHLLEKDMDYSHINDFRDKQEISQVIVEHDLECIDNADVLVVLVNGPSYGTAMEMLIAKGKGKRIVLLAKDPVPTPWPIYFSDFIVRDEQELYQLLNETGQQKKFR